VSKQHQASRRRTYGRREHELSQRTERPVRFLGWLEVGAAGDVADRAGLDGFDRVDGRGLNVLQSAD